MSGAFPGPAAGRVDIVESRRHRLRNALHTSLLLGGLFALFALIVVLLLGPAWLPAMALAMGALMLIGPRVSPAMVLRLYKARPLPRALAPEVHALADRLATAAGLPASPSLHYIPSATASAFTVGRPEEAVIALSDGLLRRLSVRELAGVLAHETAHIQHRDLVVMGLGDTLGRLTASLAQAGILTLTVTLPIWLPAAPLSGLFALAMLIAAPIAGGLLQLALSRSREFDADLGAVQLTGDPAGLASALRKVDAAQASLWRRLALPGRAEPQPSLLRSHPPTEERIARLAEVVKPIEPWLLGLPPAVPMAPGLPRIVIQPRRRFGAVRF